MKSEVKKALFRELLAFFCGMIIIVTLLTTGCTAFIPEATATQIIEKPDTSKNVTIHYAVTYQDNIREVFQARGGQTYLILDMDIQNNGYKSVNTNPLFPLISYNGTEDHSEMVVSDDYLQPAALSDSANANGSIAFQIPKSKTGSTFAIIYRPMIGPLTKYNIVLIEKQ